MSLLCLSGICLQYGFTVKWIEKYFRAERFMYFFLLQRSTEMTWKNSHLFVFLCLWRSNEILRNMTFPNDLRGLYLPADIKATFSTLLRNGCCMRGVILHHSTLKQLPTQSTWSPRTQKIPLPLCLYFSQTSYVP